MIILKELLHSIEKESKEGFIDTNEWRWPDVDHLITMGFEFDGEHHMRTTKPPKMKIYKKKGLNEKKEETSYFFIEEDGKKTRRFKNFNDVIDYFDTYEQSEVDKNME